MLNELLKDDNSEVKLCFIMEFSKIAKVVGPEILTPAIVARMTELTKPPTGWRVRCETIKTIGELSLLFGKECYAKSFEEVFMGYLSNSAAAVRQEGIVYAS